MKAELKDEVLPFILHNSYFMLIVTARSLFARFLAAEQSLPRACVGAVSRPSRPLCFFQLAFCEHGETGCLGTPFGAGDGSRTRDLKLGKLALYQLSYARSGDMLPGTEGFRQVARRAVESGIIHRSRGVG